MRSSNLLAALLLALAPALDGKPVSDKGKTPGAGSKPVIVIVAYHPRPGKEALLLELTRQHLPLLRAQGLATDRPSWAMRSADGTIIEVFEWKSAEAIAAAHQNPVWQAMCGRYSEACDYISLENLSESKNMFAEFDAVDL